MYNVFKRGKAVICPKALISDGINKIGRIVKTKGCLFFSEIQILSFLVSYIKVFI